VCGVHECDHESSKMRPWPTVGYYTMEKKKFMSSRQTISESKLQKRLVQAFTGMMVPINQFTR